jgi:tetratricopeptide (TPR) repeat protein
MNARSWLAAASLAVALIGAPACAQQPATGAAAQAALRAGHYPEAVEIGRAAVARDANDALARRALVRALAETGEYDQAIEAAGTAPELAVTRAQLLIERGRTADAEAALRAVAPNAPDRASADLELALIQYRRGDRDEAFRAFDRFIDLYNASDRLSARDLVAVGTAVRYLGERDPQLFKDALKAFDQAAAADPGDPEPKLRVGELFLEKYNSPDAQGAFREVLATNPKNPRALLGVARAKLFDGETGEAMQLVRGALEVNPQLVPARLTLARMLLDAEDDDAAEAEVRGALEVNPASLDALSLQAAIRYLRDDRAGYDAARAQLQRLNPSYAGVYTAVAEMAATHRRYADAVGLAQEAVKLDPRDWSAFGVMGLNQLRIGRVDEARASLTTAFKGDPYNAWIKNTLDLLDTYPQYQLRNTADFQLMLHGDEADLLFPYMSDLAEEAYTSLATRYGYRPQTPVRVEVYPRHADFSVRTVGLVGLGALGVSFGNVIALDSPRSRDAGEINWGSTFWHELTHAVTLGLSRNRVPRWFTEGLSTLEERRARPGWGTRTTPEFVAAYLQGKIPPVSRLNEGFIRPASPQLLGLAYHDASLVTEWIETTHGFDAILRMLRAYGEGRGTDDVFRSVLKLEPEAVDQAFDQWLRTRYTAQFAAMQDPAAFAARAAATERLVRAGDLAGARSALEADAAIFPVTAGGDSPFAALAELALGAGDQRAAADALGKAVLVDETAYAANLKLAELLVALGDTTAAAGALERAVYIYPYDVAVHLQLAKLYTAAGDHQKVVRERRAVVALKPAALADAHYQLAAALVQAGDRTGARTEVLHALEIAPNFDRAQELLLTLTAGN